MSKPILVIVTGAPGTGKTTLARQLASSLGLVLIAKDDLKEALADRLGAGDRERSRELGRMAYDELYSRAREELLGGNGVVVEANFYRDPSEQYLRRLAELARAVVVECVCDAALRRERFEQRGGRGERHAVHLDGEILANEWHDDASQYAIDLACPRMVVDTSGGYAPPLEAVASFARKAV